MTEQQYRVIADREHDDVYAVKREPFNRVTYGALGHDIVRIERPVPTTDESGEQFTPSTEQVRSHYVFDQSDRWDSERGAAFDRWLASVQSSPHPPTREQIAEGNAGGPMTPDMDAVRGIIEDIRNGEHRLWDGDWDQSNAELLDLVLALIQNGADR